MTGYIHQIMKLDPKIQNIILHSSNVSKLTTDEAIAISALLIRGAVSSFFGHKYTSFSEIKGSMSPIFSTVP